MRLSDFILANVEPILREWETFARSLTPGGNMTVLALRNDAEAVLRACARDMSTHQTEAQQSSKSKGHGGSGGTASDRLDDASSVHGVGRVGSGFNLNEVVSEYRALRASVLRLWRDSNPGASSEDIADITRFNETIDQSLAKAVAAYTDRVDQSRKMFLAILSHDLRNPLNSIRLSAQLASAVSKPNPDTSHALLQIESSVDAISRLIRDLLDFAASGLGTGMTLAIAPVNLHLLAKEVVSELRAAYPHRKLGFNVPENTTWRCDGPRIRQVISNLASNALEHGSADGEVDVTITVHEHEMLLSVRNVGPPIDPDLLPTIFNPLVRGLLADGTRRRPGSVGLGLYIVHEIVAAHGGTIDVQSSRAAGTIFTVRLPRKRNKQEPPRTEGVALTDGV